MAEQAKMAAWTYYAYNAPAKMTKSNFATMINSLETTHALPTVSRSTEDNETVLKFDEPVLLRNERFKFENTEVHLLPEMVITSAVTLRHQWTDKLQRERLSDTLPPTVRVRPAESKEELVLESSNLDDLYKAVSNIKRLVVEHLVGPDSGLRVQSNGVHNATHNDVEMDENMDGERKKKIVSFEEKMSSTKDDKHDHTGPGSVVDNSEKTVNGRRKAHQNKMYMETMLQEQNGGLSHDVTRRRGDGVSDNDSESVGDDSSKALSMENSGKTANDRNEQQKDVSRQRPIEAASSHLDTAAGNDTRRRSRQFTSTQDSESWSEIDRDRVDTRREDDSSKETENDRSQTHPKRMEMNLLQEQNRCLPHDGRKQQGHITSADKHKLVDDGTDDASAKENSGKAKSNSKEEHPKDDTRQRPITASSSQLDTAVGLPGDEARRHGRCTSIEPSETDPDDTREDNAGSVKGDDAEGMRTNTAEPRDTQMQDYYDLSPTSHGGHQAKYQMCQLVWDYIHFTYPQMNWDKKLSASRDTVLRSNIVELTGSSRDIDDLKHLCDESRLLRSIAVTRQRMSDKLTAENFRRHLHRLSENKILVRPMADDEHYCELVGKMSNIKELEKAISVHYPELVETKQISYIQQLTASTGPTLATQTTFVTSSLATASTLSSTPTAAGNGFAHAFDRTPASSESGLDFRTAEAQLRVRVVTGDLVQWRCEVLVDACDSSLSHLGGLSLLIAKAAGPAMQAECKKYIKTHRSLPQCAVTDTTAGNLKPPVRRLIHACGPNLRSCSSGDECQTRLQQTFLNCLLYGNNRMHARSIAIPAISSGVFGVPSNIVATAACHALTTFDHQMASTLSSDRYLTDIYFVNIQPEITNCMTKVFSRILQLSLPGAQMNDVAVSSSSSRRDLQLNYRKMKNVAEEKGLIIVDVPMDGDCALHAVIRQLQQQGDHLFVARKLRQLAIEHLESHLHLINFTMLSNCYGGHSRAYLQQQAVQGTLCDEAMIHAIAAVTRRDICVFDDNGFLTKFESSDAYPGKLITLGRIADAHYVSLESRSAASNIDRPQPHQFPSPSGAAADPSDKLRASGADCDRYDSPEAAVQHQYSQLKSEAEKRRLDVFDVPQTGDSALHAVIRQLALQDVRLYDVTSLRRRAIEYLYSHKYLLDGNLSDAQSYLSAQSDPGTPCGEPMLSAISEVIMKEIHVLQHDGCLRKFGLHTSHSIPAVIGVYAKVHYVSLEPPGNKREYKTAGDTDIRPEYNGGNRFVGRLTSSQSQKQATTRHASSPAAYAGTDHPLAAANDSCAICMDTIKDPKTLPCTHVFCSECINQSLAYQPKCPCCGKIFGVMKGDQPQGGTMHVTKSKWFNLDGYPGCGRIVIDYYIPDGRQKENHPNPGELYKGARRIAYLPGNAEGEQICQLLRRAFDAGLIFTVGRSTTSGRENVVTWNDIHHKTKTTGPFGYPDPTYLARVREELAAKGITSDTVDILAASVASLYPDISSSSTSNFVTTSTATFPSVTAANDGSQPQTTASRASPYSYPSKITTFSSSTTFPTYPYSSSVSRPSSSGVSTFSYTTPSTSSSTPQLGPGTSRVHGHSSTFV